MTAIAAKAHRFVTASTWKDYILSPLTNVTDDNIRNGTSTIYHPVGSASMSPVGADWGVVDPNLLLKGARGVRIVDASVLVILPTLSLSHYSLYP